MVIYPLKTSIRKLNMVVSLNIVLAISFLFLSKVQILLVIMNFVLIMIRTWLSSITITMTTLVSCNYCMGEKQNNNKFENLHIFRIKI